MGERRGLLHPGRDAAVRLDPLVGLVAAAAFSGIAVAALYPALTGIIPEVVPPERLQAGNALLGLGANVARMGGAVLGGATVVLVGGGWALAVSGALFATAGVLISLVRPTPLVRERGERHSVLKDLREGWREFSSRQWIWVVVAQFSILVMAIQAGHGVLGPLLAKESLGGPAAWSAFLVERGDRHDRGRGGVAAGAAAPSRSWSARCSACSAALPYFLLGTGSPLWLTVLGAFVLGVCFDVFGVLWMTTMQREVPPESLSRVSSYDALGSLMFGPIGLMLAAPAAALMGVQNALLACGGLVVLSTCAALLSPGVRNLRAPARLEAVSS
ncbi:MFS transporter [Nonomuraea ferruginea]